MTEEMPGGLPQAAAGHRPALREVNGAAAARPHRYAVAPFDGAEETGGEAPILRLMARYNLRREEALALVDEVLEAFGGGGGGLNCEEALMQLNALHRRSWGYLIEYQANQKSADEIRMSTRATALELGFTLAAGARTAAELARKAHFDKQAVNKCLLNVQRLIGLARREGQRTAAARETMAEARRLQIKAEKLKS